MDFVCLKMLGDSKTIHFVAVLQCRIMFLSDTEDDLGGSGPLLSINYAYFGQINVVKVLVYSEDLF